MNDQTGSLGYQIVHFDIEFTTLAKRVLEGDKCTPDFMRNYLRFFIPDVIVKLKEVGRCEDFISILQGINGDQLSVNNIALNLLLDIGMYLRADSPNAVRYSETSHSFWLVIKKLFRGKAIRFFSGDQCGTKSIYYFINST